MYYEDTGWTNFQLYEFIVPEEKMPDLSSKRIIRPFKPGEEHYVAEAHERIYRDRFGWGDNFSRYAKKLVFMLGVLIMLSFSGCGTQKYRVNFDGYGFESRKTEYAEGERVTVYYNFIATDTDYYFYIDDDVEMRESYDDKYGYVFTFKMPGHDVTLHEESRNSMVYVPPHDYTDADITGISILQSDIVDFCYTYDWSGYNALYQRYRFYTEDGEYWFEHETRKTEDDYGWASEADITASGTVSLSIYEWDEFLYYLTDGIADEPKESDETGDSGPWMYLYYRAEDTTVRKQFHFASAERQTEFEEFCQSLAQEQPDN